MDWGGGKLHDSAQPAKPVDLPLPVGLDVKLGGAEGGLVLGYPSPQPSPAGRGSEGKPQAPASGSGSASGDSDSGQHQSTLEDAQLLLRADSAQLDDKGVVLGKLGGAELVLKRPAKEPKLVDPVKPPVVESVDPDKPKSKPTENNAPSFTPGATQDPHSPWHIGPPALTGLILLGFGLALLLRSPVKLTEDSPKFTKALKTWHPLIAESCKTPRMVKRYLNWVRFLAMRYRPAEPKTAGFGLRLARRLDWAKPAEPVPKGEKFFDEDILVALSAIYQYRREWVLDLDKFNHLQNGNFSSLFKDESLENNQATIESIAQARQWNFTAHAQPFNHLTPADWQKAAEQRERFIDAVGNVDVA
ncbi:MAG: hypothetical protein ACKN9T_15520 [Candidatus Methylumidiphilus sp.]